MSFEAEEEFRAQISIVVEKLRIELAKAREALRCDDAMCSNFKKCAACEIMDNIDEMLK